MDKDYESMELEIKTWGFKNADDFIRKNLHKLSERQIELLDMIGFEFREK